MSAARAVSLLCASVSWAAPAAAQEAEPFVMQVRAPARGAVRDVFVWREAGNLLLERSALVAMGFAIPDHADGNLVPLSAIPGLGYEEDSASAAIVITCPASCYSTQVLNADEGAAPEVTRAFGGYVNYDLTAQRIDGEDTSFGVVAEAALFGGWGLIETSWLARSAREQNTSRLESRWTLDVPNQRLRVRVGDSVAVNTAGAPFRFGGVQLGREFALAPSIVTHPTPTMAGEARAASTVELYVNGALRAREAVNAGPFIFENVPLVSGAGEAHLVVTDILGRSEVAARPFFVSTTMLRPGLSAWSVAAGAERLNYGSDGSSYGEAFFAGRYRRGLANFLTLEGALELRETGESARLGATVADARFGQFTVARVESGAGATSEASWHGDGRLWSGGLQWRTRDVTFGALGDAESNISSSAAANLSFDLGAAGSVSLTATQLRFANESPARSMTFAYAPDIGDGALSIRVRYAEQDEQELAFAVSWSLALRGDISAQLGMEASERGRTLRASAQRDADARGGFSWRARGAAGEGARADVAGSYHGPLGESMLQAAGTRHATGVRASHTGSIGWIERHAFAGRRIEGAFALVDAGAADVGVSRDRTAVGTTNSNGRLLAVNLRPYDTNSIAIAADDLPLDRAPPVIEARVTPAQSAGVVVSFPQAHLRLIESWVNWASGEPAPRGAVLVRPRDGARFPVGSAGRVVLRGALPGDVLQLDNDARCTARAEAGSVERGLVLRCADP